MSKDPVGTIADEIDRLFGAGHIDQAIERCRLALADSATPADSRWHLAAQTGSCCVNAQRLDDGIRLLGYAVEVKPDGLGAGEAMQLFTNLAIALCGRGSIGRGSIDDLIRALTVLQQGLDVESDAPGHDAERAELHGHRGNVMSMLGAHAAGESHYHEALAHARSAADAAAVARWTGDFGMSRLGAADPEAAISLLTEALDTAPEATRAQNGGRWDAGLREAQALVARRSAFVRTAAHTPSAFVFDGLSPRVSVIPTVNEKKALIASERAQIDATIMETIADGDPLDALALIDCVKSLVGRELMYRKRLEMSIFAGTESREETGVLHGLRREQFAEQLVREEGQVLVSFYYTEQHDYHAFIATAMGGVPRVERVLIASDYAGYRLSQHLQSLIERRRDDPAADIDNLTLNVMSEVSQAILPRLRRIPGVRRVLLCPYKLLHCLPLHVMMMRDGGSALFLEDLACVSYAGSLMANLAGRTKLPRRAPKQDCVLFAYVEDPGDGSIDPLEADAYQAAFGRGGWFRTTRDPEAIPDDLGDVPFICWSSHAISDPTTWDSSYLSAGTKEISASTIVDQWLLRETHCAVLSGCETACDNSMSDAVDEYFGLDQAVHIAGANSVLGTIYPVDDDFAGVMTLFLLDGMLRERLSPSEALRQARIQITSGEWTRSLRRGYEKRRAEKGGSLDARTTRFFDRALAIDPLAFESLACWSNYRCLGNW